MQEVQRTVSPVDGSVYVERPLASEREIGRTLETARTAQAAWRGTPLAVRAEVCRRFVDAVVAKTPQLAEEISWQMGRPIAQSPKELGGFAERARYMIEIAQEALADIRLPERPGFARFIRREPLGVVLTVAPWNYPYLTAVNSIVPAIMAGNVVILRHSGQTPLCAERLREAFDAVDLPPGVFQYVHCAHAEATRLIRQSGIDFVAFTGSVEAGHTIQRAAAERFIGTGLELGGKDPAYVCADVNLAHAVENLVDGAFFNSGQSCCGIERIYVHEKVYTAFVEQFATATRQYRLGNPLDPTVTLGPMAKASATAPVRRQIDDAVAAGARALIDSALFSADQAGTPYMAPQVLVDVDHSMRVMTEETFGPVVGIMRVRGDDEAVTLMNDSPYGLTASIWTNDIERATMIGERIDTGTWFMNRCDYLDPGLAWTGVKDSGRGCTLSRVGYEALTRPKSFHLRTLVDG